MGPFAVGDILLVRSPFSNLSGGKLRPAVVAALSDFNNVVLCQITSQAPNSATSVALAKDGVIGKDILRKTSYIRVNKLFTADPELVVKRLGELGPSAKHDLHTKILEIFGQFAA